MKRKFYTYLISLWFMLISPLVYTQGPPPNPGDVPVPIDGGVFYLLVSSIAFGVYSLKRKK